MCAALFLGMDQDGAEHRFGSALFLGCDEGVLQTGPKTLTHSRGESRRTKIFGMKRNETVFWGSCK
jgi:hypothetical protein